MSEKLWFLKRCDLFERLSPDQILRIESRSRMNRLKNLLFLPNRERLAHLLLDLAEQFGQHSVDGIRLRVKLTHQDMGNLIGSTRETVTVTLGQLRSAGNIV